MSEELNYTRCDQEGCDNLAIYSCVWMRPQVYCHTHMMRVLGIAEAMGFPTVAATMRTLTPDEMLPEDDARDADHGGA